VLIQAIIKENTTANPDETKDTILNNEALMLALD